MSDPDKVAPAGSPLDPLSWLGAGFMGGGMPGFSGSSSATAVATTGDQWQTSPFIVAGSGSRLDASDRQPIDTSLIIMLALVGGAVFLLGGRR